MVILLSQVPQNTTVSAEWPAMTFLMDTAEAGRTRGQNVELNIVVNIPTSAGLGWLTENREYRPNSTERHGHSTCSRVA